MNDVLLVVMVAASLLGFLAVARYRYRSKLEQWRDLLAPTGQDAAEAVTEQSALDKLMADHAFEESLRAREGHDRERAVRFLELALRVIEEATPNRLARLGLMGQLVRMSMAILPSEALPASRFRLSRLVLVAHVGAALDALLVAPGERMAVRLKILGVRFGLTLHVLRASARAAGRRPDLAAAWDRFRLALADWNTLDEEHLRSLRALLATVAVELQRDVIAHQP